MFSQQVGLWSQNPYPKRQPQGPFGAIPVEPSTAAVRGLSDAIDTESNLRFEDRRAPFNAPRAGFGEMIGRSLESEY